MGVGKFVTVVLGAALLFGCETHYVMEQPTITVINLSSRSFASIQYSKCGSGKVAKLSEGLASGESVTALVHAECIDVIAVEKSGEVFARQDRVSIPPSFRWIIK